MKNKFAFWMVFVLFACVISSCTQINDYRISRFENSIDKLEKKYKEYSPEKLKSEIEDCEKQLKKLSNDSSRYTDSQKRRISNLKGRYHRLLIEIKIYSFTQSITEEGKNVLEYIKGILGGISLQMEHEGLKNYENDSVPETDNNEDTTELVIDST